MGKFIPCSYELASTPKYSIANVIGFLKGKSTVRIHRRADNKQVSGFHFWSRGYCVSIVGPDEDPVRKYIRDQEKGRRSTTEI